jgi:hypothetical protein
VTTRGLFHRRGRGRYGPRHRPPGDGRRDDDTAAEEYSPLRPVCQVAIAGARRTTATALSIFKP